MWDACILHACNLSPYLHAADSRRGGCQWNILRSPARCAWQYAPLCTLVPLPPLPPCALAHPFSHPAYLPTVDTADLNEAICSGVRAAGYDPESVMIEPDEQGKNGDGHVRGGGSWISAPLLTTLLLGLYYLGSEVEPCCLAWAGGLAMIKAGPAAWMTLTRYILDYWGVPAVVRSSCFLPYSLSLATPYLWPCPCPWSCPCLCPWLSLLSSPLSLLTPVPTPGPNHQFPRIAQVSQVSPQDQTGSQLC